jgi:DNA-binding LytR/AlgR family response regulator
VISVRAVGNRTEIATLVSVLKVRCPLKDVIETLTVLGLVQLRRDLAVNAARVRRMVGGGRHRLLVVLDDGACVAVGRQFQRDIRARFGRPGANRI